jgi:hypothetical protein
MSIVFAVALFCYRFLVLVTVSNGPGSFVPLFIFVWETEKDKGHFLIFLTSHYGPITMFFLFKQIC